MASVNESVFDKKIGFYANLGRVETEVADQVFRQMRELQQELARLVAGVDLSGPEGRKRRQVFAALNRQAAATAMGAYGEIDAYATSQLRGIAELSADVARSAVNTSFGVDIATTTLAPSTLRALASNTLIEGAPSSAWWRNQADNVIFDFKNQMSLGAELGESVPQLIGRVMGSETLAGLVTGKEYRAAALVRSSIISVANEAHIKTYEANDDIFESLQWVSTLDSRTSDTCKGLDGLRWRLKTYEPIGHSVPWPGRTAHWGCRSTQVPDIKPFEGIPLEKQKQLLEGGFRLGKGPNGYGLVPQNLTYTQWLGQQPEGFQREVLGPTKYDLWKDGKLSFTDMLDQQGNPLNITQLKGAYAPTGKIITPNQVSDISRNRDILTDDMYTHAVFSVGDSVDNVADRLAVFDNWRDGQSLTNFDANTAFYNGLREQVAAGTLSLRSDGRATVYATLTPSDKKLLYKKTAITAQGQNTPGPTLLPATFTPEGSADMLRLTGYPGEVVRLEVPLDKLVPGIGPDFFVSSGSNKEQYAQYLPQWGLRNPDVGNPVEAAILYGRDGKLVGSFTTYSPNSVGFSSEDYLAGKFKGGTLFHNHPSSSTLSFVDLTTLGRESLELSKIVAVGHNVPVYYSAKVGATPFFQSTVPNFDQALDRFYLSADQALRRIFLTEINDDLVAQMVRIPGYTSGAAALSQLHHHTLWRVLDRRGIIEYDYGSTDLAQPIDIDAQMGRLVSMVWPGKNLDWLITRLDRELGGY